MQESGIDVIGHVEINDNINKIHELNFPNSTRLGKDICNISDKEIEGWKQKFGHIDMIFGSPPCQGFSLAGKRNINDKRNQLYKEYIRIVNIIKPNVFLLENVAKLTSMKDIDGNYVVDNIISAFDNIGYDVIYNEVNAQDYGVPQFRERIFILGVKKEHKVILKFPEITHGKPPLLPYNTFRNVTQDLETLESGEKSKTDKWHFAVNHPKYVIEWLKDVPEGESAHNNKNINLRPPSGFNTTYKRIKWDEPCSTIGTTFGMISASRNVHPVNTRSFTIREAMRVQTFPDDFILDGTLQTIRTAIGNAVPPMLSKIFGLYVQNNILAKI